VEKAFAILPEYTFNMASRFPTPQYPGRLQWKNKGQPDHLPQAHLKCIEAVGTGPDPAKIFLGDNLAAMSHLIDSGHAGRFQLVYIDPPFCSGSNYSRTLRLRGPQGGPLGKEIGQQVQYTDQWSEEDYLQFCFERILLIHSLLSDTGSIVLHVDQHMSHMLRCVLDEVFGRGNFVNQIIWHYADNFQGNVRGLANNHNLLFWYSKAKPFKANPVRIPLAKPTKRDRRIWSKSEKKVVAARDKNGKILYDLYTDKKADDVWSIGQSSVSKIRSHEYLGYPTQKPEALLKRILQATTDPGDWVLDAFSGSGTTAAVAQKMGRKWMVCDSNPVAVQTLSARLQAIYFKQNNGDSPNPKGGVEIQDPATSGLEIWSIDHEKVVPRVGQIDVKLSLCGSDLRLEIGGVQSESLTSELEVEIDDWRRAIATIRIDPDFDQQTLHSRIWDCPAKADWVRSEFRIPLAHCGQWIAVRMVDIFGQELSWLGQAPPQASTAKDGR
jgi:DNA modification methylase